jgi:hypothetical protein
VKSFLCCIYIYQKIEIKMIFLTNYSHTRSVFTRRSSAHKPKDFSRLPTAPTGSKWPFVTFAGHCVHDGKEKNYWKCNTLQQNAVYWIAVEDITVEGVGGLSKFISV